MDYKTVPKINAGPEERGGRRLRGFLPAQIGSAPVKAQPWSGCHRRPEKRCKKKKPTFPSRYMSIHTDTHSAEFLLARLRSFFIGRVFNNHFESDRRTALENSTDESTAPRPISAPKSGPPNRPIGPLKQPSRHTTIQPTTPTRQTKAQRQAPARQINNNNKW